ncbi:hypothetical protein ABZ401_32620, partial [Streptomyces sp. NPDC005892]|uniref:hypothetical protein n=1 Tax=Streptomyces sp. NPDC005892 TaxID=3155593 RepID=UPI0033D3F8DF
MSNVSASNASLSNALPGNSSPGDVPPSKASARREPDDVPVGEDRGDDVPPTDDGWADPLASLRA